MIEFRGVTKQFPDGTVAVRDVDIVIPPHKTTVLVGSSGSGKTTLLRMINRMIDPTAGQVLIDGTDVATRDPVKLRRGIGYVMQNSGLLPHRKVIDNIATVPLLRGTGKREAHAHAL
jgi:osmoprotectant transport system ATP-binding protein